MIFLKTELVFLNILFLFIFISELLWQHSSPGLKNEAKITFERKKRAKIIMLMREQMIRIDRQWPLASVKPVRAALSLSVKRRGASAGGRKRKGACGTRARMRRIHKSPSRMWWWCCCWWFFLRRTVSSIDRPGLQSDVLGRWWSSACRCSPPPLFAWSYQPCLSVMIQCFSLTTKLHQPTYKPQK